jgi:hypothetical protein
MTTIINNKTSEWDCECQCCGNKTTEPLTYYSEKDGCEPGWVCVECVKETDNLLYEAMIREQELGMCNECKKDWGTGKWCKTEHNHSHGEDMLICCDCWCEKNPDFHCPDAWRYREWEEAEEVCEVCHEEKVGTTGGECQCCDKKLCRHCGVGEEFYCPECAE